MWRRCSWIPFIPTCVMLLAVPMASSFSGCSNDYCIIGLEGRTGGSGSGNDYNIYFTLTEQPTGSGQTTDYEVNLGWIYIVEADTPPIYSNVGINNTIVGQPTLFHTYWQDDTSLSGYIFSWNNSGEWVNDSWVEMTGTYNWSNVTKTINDTIGIEIGWRIYANDTSNNWNDAGIQVLTTIEGIPPDPITGLIATDEGSGGRVILRWDASQALDFDHYNVYIDMSDITDVTGMIPIDNLTYQFIAAKQIGGLTNGIMYYFAVTAVDVNGNENKTTVSTANVTPSQWATDDLDPNAVKGIVYMSDGTTPASNTTLINITVSSGSNAGYTFITNVDASPVPPFLIGNGYYDFGDRKGFSTDATFTIRAENGTHYGKNNGAFILGTLGGFGTGSLDIIMNITIDTIPPTYSNLTPQNNSNTSDTGQDISIIITDEGSDVNAGSISMTVAGNYYDTNSGKLDYDTNSGLLTYYADDGEFNGGQVVYVVAYAEDDVGNQMEVAWSFTVTITEFNIPLNQEWNMISIPLEQDNWSITSVLASIEGNYTVVFAYINGTWKKSTSRRYPITEMSLEYGYWINMTVPDTLELSGTVPSSTTIDVIPEWNLAGYPTLDTRNLTEVLSTINYTVVFTYMNGTWQKSTSRRYPLTNMTPGYGYWINATEAGSYEVEN